MAVEKLAFRDYSQHTMGLADRHYMRQPYRGGHWSATVVLIVSLAIVFVLQGTVIPLDFLFDYLALSLPGLEHGYVWQLLTYQFLHAGWLHLLFNCLGIFIFGRELETVLGKSRFFTLYFMSGVAGGLLQLLGARLWPHYLGGPMVGASAGACGLLAAYAMRDPSRELSMLFGLMLPLRMRARTLLILSVVLALVGIGCSLLPKTAAGSNVAHAAHLGGLLMGYVWVKLGWHHDYIPLPWERWYGRWSQWRPFSARQRKRELIKAASVRRSPWRSPTFEPEVPSEEFMSREVDPILDKISQHGIQSLTEQERRILESARDRMAKK